ncbi:MAG: hypothetical protein GY820_21010 [Gammaproteobacteria bacterium]|nr:hypothetical protein [Gammaproteobacteria bacterium]
MATSCRWDEAGQPTVADSLSLEEVGLSLDEFASSSKVDRRRLVEPRYENTNRKSSRLVFVLRPRSSSVITAPGTPMPQWKV